jgi:hypothetical protein
VPNHVTTRLTFEGPANVIETLKEAISTDHPAQPSSAYDGREIYKKAGFNGVGWYDGDTNKFQLRDFSNKDPDTMHEGVPEGWEREIEPAWTNHIDFEKIVPRPPCIFIGDMSSIQERENPNRNWLAWSNKHWGTKWGSYETSTDDQGRIIFQTAWSIPQPVLEALSWLFPEVTLLVESVDEGWNFWGTMTYRAGELIHDNMCSDRSDKD